MSNHKLAIQAILSRISSVEGRLDRERSELQRLSLILDPPEQAELAQRQAVRTKGVITGLERELSELEESIATLERDELLARRLGA